MKCNFSRSQHYFFLNLFERVTDKEGQIFRLLVHSLNDGSHWGSARVKPGLLANFLGGCRGPSSFAIFHCFVTHISRDLDQSKAAGTQIGIHMGCWHSGGFSHSVTALLNSAVEEK